MSRVVRHPLIGAPIGPMLESVAVAALGDAGPGTVHARMRTTCPSRQPAHDECDGTSPLSDAHYAVGSRLVGRDRPDWNEARRTMTEWSPRPGEPEHRDAYPPAPIGGYTVTPQTFAPSLDPLISSDYNGWWSRGISIVKRGWKPLAALQAGGLLLVLVFEAPVGAYAALVSQRMTQSAASGDFNGSPDITPLLVLGGVALAVVMLTVIITGIITLATVHIGVAVAVGAEARVGDALRLAARRVFPLIGWQLLAAPIYLVAVCLCVLPVFYVAAVFLVLPVVVAIERTNAIGRCFSLFHTNFGPAAARTATILGITIGSAVVGALIGSVLDLVATAAAPGDAGVLVGSVASTLVGAVITGVVAILVAPLTLTTYADLRARTELLRGVDIAHQLGIAAPTTTSWPTHPTGYAMPPPA
jgi:hypothetical protein